MKNGLYGLDHSNRSQEEHWTKNCFNSSFPTALACYMMDHDIPAIYCHLDLNADGDLYVKTDTIDLHKVFNCDDLTSADLNFNFESSYPPYEKYVLNKTDIEKIDVVVTRNDVWRTPLAPLEVKLTVLPDSTTLVLPENEWGCEMVVRTATTAYMELGMFETLEKEHATKIFDIFNPICFGVQDWNNETELLVKYPHIRQAINEFEAKYFTYQKPLIMEPIWKTEGQSPMLSENTFDLVIWSDYAFSRLFLDFEPSKTSKSKKKLARPQRATLRMARILWELSRSRVGKIHLKSLMTDISLNNQTDKEFSIPGKKWRQYVNHERITTPQIKLADIDQILDKSKLKDLRPERRLDQSLFFLCRE